MKLPIPPLNPLRVFDIAARCSSFTEAARELSVTQAAVSRQIGVLEAYLRIKLFDRDQRTLTLTPDGKRLHRDIGRAFEMIGWASAVILGRHQAFAVTLQTYPTLAAKWLLPRLEPFLLQNETLIVNIKTAIRPCTFSTETSDILIRFGGPPSDDLEGFPLFADRVAPVCTPRLFAHYGNDCRTLLEHARLLSSKYRSSDWMDWARFSDIDIRNANTMSLDGSHLAYQAASEGLGVVAAQLAIVESDIADSRLILPFSKVLQRDLHYWCVWPKFRRKTKSFRLVVDWLRGQAELKVSAAA